MRAYSALEILIGVAVGLTILSIAFAAVALGMHLRTRWQEQRRQRLHQTWRNALLAVLAGEQPPQELIDQVQADCHADFLSFLIPYATTVRGEAREQIRTVARPFLETAKEQLSDSRSLVRAQAVQRIGLLGGARYADALRSCLDDPSPQVVAMAARRLAKVGDAAETDLILNSIGRIDDMDRRQITSALVELGDEAAPAFRAALADSSRSPFVRVCCAETLRWLSDSSSASVAERLLRSNSSADGTLDPELTASLLRLLRRVGRAQHASAVRPYLSSTESFIRIHAARALGQLGGPEDEDALAALFRSDESQWVALSAARGLIELGHTTLLQRLRASDHSRSALANDVLPAPE